MLYCRSRELEGDGEEEKEQTANLSCSLMTFTEFNYGAVKNKVMWKQISGLLRK